MSFNHRTNKGNLLQEKVFADLKNAGLCIAINGTEHTHPDFVKRLLKSEDSTSLMIRYQPDGVVAFGETVTSAYVEVKNSKTIEKNAYLNYLQLHINGALVFIVFEGFYCRVEDMDFSKENPRQWNLDQDGWLAPRLTPEKLFQAKQNGFPGSGTPYKHIDQIRGMKSYNNFLKEFK